ncbi:MAG: hypothetical protein V9H26_06575 [Verrucomicrobiota bacterium]
MQSQLYLGQNALRVPRNPIAGKQVVLAGEACYQIANYDQMRPFFMTVVSDADHWLFISSNGGLTAGRRDANLALFPYYTDDKIRDMADVTGSKTLLRVHRRGRTHLWEPFSDRAQGIYRVRRNLYKNFWGNQLMFEEINEDLALTFRYGWFNSQQFGFVRRAWLINAGAGAVRVTLLDGVQNLMPCGTGSQFNLEYSTLHDAYKKSELLPKTGLGLFRLSAIPVDRPEPAEALRTTVAWSVGLKRQLVLLSSVQLDGFRTGQSLHPETDVRAERGAYFVQSEMSLRRGQSTDWLIVADVNQGPSGVTRLNQLLRQPAQLRKSVLADVQRGTVELQRLVAAADGLQQTALPLGGARHYANTLFNIMRGGVFNDGYQLDTDDLLAFVKNANTEIAARHAAFFRRLPKLVLYGRMVAMAAAVGDPQLERVCREYLPLTFSRRHGDPSRPWNKFSITTRNADGQRSLNYEGNWRDIFQNWEALALSFPGYTAGMICRFLNASTADGYNPYRITRNGIDWEVVAAHDPWSYIGYWGDHQIIYLLKLLEQLAHHEPVALRAFLTRDIFAYANVPYRIKPYASLLANPKDSVVFDQHLEQIVQERVQAKGADGKLVWDKHGQVRLVNLTEKLLVPLLAKLSNFIPGAGIWLNTQRPEWNDANNALVGNGCSMVTLYYIRRYLTFCQELFRGRADQNFTLSAEVSAFLDALNLTLRRHRGMLGGKITDAQRHRIVDDLGSAGSEYRQRIYSGGFSQRKTPVSGQQLLDFFAFALDWTHHSIHTNRRPDGLYHSYNLVRLEDRKALPIRRLYEMLEGQVAVLSSGQLSAGESLTLLAALKRGAMYRADQHSYLLYPNRQLPRFVERNLVPAKEIRRSALLRKLLADANPYLIERDVAGRVHFNATMTNARDLRRILNELATPRYARLIQRDTPLVLEIFERLFDHESFTGRSGTFFGYEGLGSIYWHMVSKLLLAVQETYFRAVDSGVPATVLNGLAASYYDVRAGLGDGKSPQEYGAFPMDPYSHTPAQAGARQPGLTGQVKEDILCRRGELGVFVSSGKIHFRPLLLRREEFLRTPSDFRYFDLGGAARCLQLPANALAFTLCQTPIIYQLGRATSAARFGRARQVPAAGQDDSLTLVYANGTRQQFTSLELDPEMSRAIFDRKGSIQRIVVSLGERWLRGR